VSATLKRFRKLIGSLVGGVSGGLLVTIADVAGWTWMTPELGSAVALVLAAVGTVWAPANALKSIPPAAPVVPAAAPAVPPVA
jgi:hypothetical protein